VGKDEETGLSYFGARYEDAKSGRFIAPDPMRAVDSTNSGTNEKLLLDPQRLNPYAYALNNPYRYVDLDGREVTINIVRQRYSGTSVMGAISVSSDKTSATFNGNTLETTKAGDNHDKPPIAPGTYAAKVRKDHDPNRVELKDVDNYTNVQIHIGNTVTDVKGCFAVGNTSSEDYVGDSRNAMRQINKIIKDDGTGKITVNVTGARNKSE
jgi:RHS repeat-associated protein